MRRIFFLAGLSALASVASFPPPARAEGDTGNLAQGLGFSGSVRTGYWSANRNLDAKANFAATSLWLKTQRDIGNGFYVSAEGWLLDERAFNGGARQQGELREGYFGWRDDKIEVSVGRRIINWGRVDWFNPTDVISPRDYTLLFVDDSDLRRTGVVATASYAFNDMIATVLWAPEFRPNIYPISALPGIVVTQGPDRFNANQFGARLDRTGASFDWSISYFNGINRDPGARQAATPQVSEVVDAVYNRMQMWGADFATNIGSFGLRGEVAYRQPTSGLTTNIFNPRPSLDTVVGVDYRVVEHWNVNVQYIVHHTFSYAPISNGTFGGSGILRAVATKAALLNNQYRQLQHGPSLRVVYSGWNDTLQMEVSGATFVTDGSALMRARATYAITDHVKAIAGVDIFQGVALSYFGQMKRASTLFSQIRYDF